MSQAHSIHDGIGVALYDGCGRCAYLSTNIDGLDDASLRRLASLADGIMGHHLQTDDYSINDAIAVYQLRRQARIVFASQITEEVAR